MNILQTIKDHTSRASIIIAAAILLILLLLPGFELKFVIRYITFFALFTASGWAALRVFWPERTTALEKDGDSTYRAHVRDLCYAIMVSAAIVGSASLSV